MKNTNKFNFRPILIISISAILGILSGIIWGYYSFKEYALIFCTVIIAFICLFFIRNKKLSALITYILAVIIFFSFSLYVKVSSNNLKYANVPYSGEVKFNGQVKEISSIVENANGEYLYSIVVKGNVEDKYKNVKLKVYTYSKDRIYAGSNIVLSCKLQKQTYDSLKSFINALSNNYDYNVESAVVYEVNPPTDFVNVIKLKALDNLILTSSNNAGIIYAMLTGEEYLMYDSDINIFRMLGVAHIFAVSGLHIGFLYGLIIFLLSLLKIKGKKGCIISSIILFLYIAFCGFSSSSIRAFVIIFISRLSVLFGYKNDKLNTYFLAVLVVLLINPFNLFSIGTLLSFVAYFGIVFISPILSKKLENIFNKKLASAVSTCIVAYFVTLPIVLDNFGGASLFSSMFNFFIVPVVGIIYPFAFVGVLLSFISPLKLFMFIPNLLIDVILFVAMQVYISHFYVTNLKFKSSKIYYYLFFVFLTDKINLTKNERLFTLLTLFITFLLSFIAINVYGDILLVN